MLSRFRKYYLNSSLSKKIILLITLFVTIVPTTLIATLAIAYYKIGVESLFNEQIGKSISQTVEVSNRYLKEHKDNIKADTFALAKDIEKNYNILLEEPALFVPFLDKQAELRNLSEIVVFQYDKIVAKNSFSFAFAFERLPEQELLEADTGEVVILSSINEDKVRAVIKLSHFVNTYLLVGRYVDQSIIDYSKNTQGSALKYNDLMTDLKSHQLKLEITFIIAFVILCSISLILGRKLAVFITRPLNNLVDATRKLKSGDFSHKLPEKDGKDETAILTRAFNQMTETLFTQRSELIRFNKLVDERRRFIEKILSEISAGVITIDNFNQVLLVNQSAKSLLNLQSFAKRTPLQSVFPELMDLVADAKQSPNEITQNNLKINRDGKLLHLFVRIGILSDEDAKTETIIITFDDITELVSAQRASAWGDVARRVAHEIKNPLTPIILSAERIKAKYSSQIKEEPENFEKYVSTIIRHVQDIGCIVEEFVEFARIPTPKVGKHNLVSIIKELIFSQKVSTKNIEYEFTNNIGEVCDVQCDSMQISQALLNILKNAAESIEQINPSHRQDHCGKVSLEINKRNEEFVEIKIVDNGIGMSLEVLEKIFEPYVTTKSKGTGLGLSIVKKIIEDHGGMITIKPLDPGAEIKFTLPLYRSDK
ncbi:MAG: nitrogen regulation protein NtrY [Candidatus Midichloriaceae bacterium]|jgi:two-component system nitrogen regulation sensor histidine kinase NtrY|nr:nitrogen regulation protein NtrY [Candidatus Midichloriaceae bacterium]